MATKRIIDLPQVPPAEGLSIPVDSATGSTGRVLLGPTGVPAVIGSQFGVNAAIGGGKTRFHLAKLPQSSVLTWKRVLSVNIGTTNWLGTRGWLYLGREGEGPFSISTVAFSIGRQGNGSVALHIGVVPGLTFPLVTDATIVGDPATGLYELWVYGDWLTFGSVEYHIVENISSITYGPFTESSSEPTGVQVLKWSTAPASQTLSYGYIVAQSLSPTSGYIRWDNGVQVAWARVGSGSFGSQSGGGGMTDPYLRQYIWTYPATFAEVPTVQATIETASVGVALANVYNVGSTSATVWAKYGVSGASFTAHICAVGRWRI